MKRKAVHAIIETPKGSRNKYKYDSFLKLFKLDKVLPAGFVFPYDFGFIPNTIAEDGDPLDVLIITEEASFTGCLVECRILGVIEANQTEDGKTFRNDRIIAVPENCYSCNNISSLKDLDKNMISELEMFFVSYHQQRGVKFKPIKVTGPDQAIKLIEEAGNGDH